MSLKNPIAQPRNSKGSLTNRMNCAEDRTLGLEDKAEDLDQISKTQESSIHSQMWETEKSNHRHR